MLPEPGEFINFVKKGWGNEQWIKNDCEYCVKILFVEKGKKCSIHNHELKKETFIVLKGKIELILKYEHESVKYILKTGDFITIPRKVYHRFIALKDSKIIECSTQHFDSDSYRIEKGD